jgi:hypothetical protein
MLRLVKREALSSTPTWSIRGDKEKSGSIVNDLAIAIDTGCLLESKVNKVAGSLESGVTLSNFWISHSELLTVYSHLLQVVISLCSNCPKFGTYYM